MSLLAFFRRTFSRGVMHGPPTQAEVQARCLHRLGSIGGSPAMPYLVALFEGRLSPEEYRLLPDMPLDRSECIECGRVTYIPADWEPE